MDNSIQITSLVNHKKSKKEETEIIQGIIKDIKNLLKDDKLEEAMSLIKEQGLVDDHRVYIPIINMLTRKGMLEQAEQIGNMERFKNNPEIQLHFMKALIKGEKFKQAKEIGNRQEFINGVHIQMQIVRIYKKEKEYDKALEIVTREQFINDVQAQVSRIKILLDLGRLPEAEQIACREEFKDNDIMQSQMEVIRKIRENINQTDINRRGQENLSDMQEQETDDGIESATVSKQKKFRNSLFVPDYYSKKTNSIGVQENIHTAPTSELDHLN